jgi:cell division septal protein FtsQ
VTILDKASKKNKRKSTYKTKGSKKNLKKYKNKVNSKKKENKKNIIKRKSKRKLIIITTLIALALVAISLSYYLLKTPKFNITSIVVSGNTKASIDEVINNSGIKLGDNIVESTFTIDKKTILNMPYISNVNVSINFPSEFIIQLTERKSLYYAFDKEKNLYYKLDENGIILEKCDNLLQKEEELLVNGITFDNDVKINTQINEIDYSKLLIYRKIEKEFIDTFPNIEITKVSFENSLTKIYLNDKIEVILPNDTNLKYNLTFLKDIIDNIGDKQGTIDMTKENPTFISF